MSGKNAVTARWHFGIPIYEKELPNFSPKAASITQHLYRLKDQDKGITRSNQGGWHSSDTLHLTEHPDCKWLMHRILQVSTNIIKSFEDDRPFKDIRMVAAWANINYRGNWNAPHEHLPCTWSGVFYVDAGEPGRDGEAGALDGQVLFFDPLPLGREWKRPPATGYQPVAGKMLLFPSFLTHMVAPYYGEKPRISIAFNMVVDR
ncbi:MAG: TIGR02466 family protein [Alcanivoracaceae bacterium]|jgi:uncharacterized protein (TIGR02466 family)|nr:TIGR02466 family protein [Alcanivoracaceae bacterium]